jgi:hypothetical protein
MLQSLRGHVHAAACKICARLHVLAWLRIERPIRQHGMMVYAVKLRTATNDSEFETRQLMYTALYSSPED